MNDIPDAQVADALARRANVLTVPPPELDQLRQLAERRPKGHAPLVTRGIAAAAVVAVLAAGAYAVVEVRADPTATHSAGAPTATGAGISDAELAGGAPVVLRRIATVAETAPITVPRADQFVYTKLTGVGVLKGSSSDRPQSFSSEVWVAQAAGTDSLAVYGDGTRVTISSRIESDPGTDVQMATYADLTRIPTDQAGLRAHLDEQFPGRPLRGAELLLEGNLVPPALASAIYRLLADEPGLEVDPDVTDAAGRPGVGVGQTDEDGVLHELIFDRDRLRLIGTRDVQTAGQVVASVAFVEQAIVDDAGELPR